MSPSEAEIEKFLYRQVELWNDGEHDEFMAAYRAISPGGFSVENPVGSTPQTGWAALEELWRTYQAITTLAYDTVFTAPTGEAAVLERVRATIDGRSVERHSLHTYTFAPDGLHARYFVDGRPEPAPPGLRDFVPRQAQYWNDGDRAGFLRLYREVSGSGFHLEYPLGTPEISGWESIEKMFDQYQSNTKIFVDHVAAAGNGEIAAYVRNDSVRDGVAAVNISLETYRIAEDGLHVRYFHAAHP